MRARRHSIANSIAGNHRAGRKATGNTLCHGNDIRLDTIGLKREHIASPANP